MFLLPNFEQIFIFLFPRIINMQFSILREKKWLRLSMLSNDIHVQNINKIRFSISLCYLAMFATWKILEWLIRGYIQASFLLTNRKITTKKLCNCTNTIISSAEIDKA